jgi:hypothetical protein
VTVETIVRRTVGGNRAFEDRLAALEEELLGGWAPWLQRLDRAGGERDGLAWERWDGHLVRFERWTELQEPERQLAELLGDTPVIATLVRTEDGSELTFVAGAGDRASRRERERVEEALDAWADDLAEHVAATAELWRYLEAHPSRARAVVAGLFEDLLDEEDRGRLALRPEEEEALRRAQEAQEVVVEIFDLPEDEAYTLQESSRRVFDPFPAAFTVELPEGSRLLEREGFELAEGNRLVVPRLSLWDSFESIAGRWVWPDPLVAHAHHVLRDRDAPFLVEAFLDQEFRYPVASPTGSEVGARLREALGPRDVLRAVWTLPPAPLSTGDEAADGQR